MGKVKITLSGALAKIAGEKIADVEASTVKEAIGALAARYEEQFRNRICDEKGKLRRFVNVYVNGKDVRFLGQLDSQLNDGDKVSIIPAVGGG